MVFGFDTKKQDSATLQCPDCRVALSSMDWRGVVVDVCHQCHGIWCDWGEMLAIEESDTLDHIDRAFEGTYVEKPVDEAFQGAERSCPRDQTALTRHEWRGDSKIVLDHCATCQGTWLDAGELEGYVAFLKDLEEHPPQLSEADWAQLKALHNQTEAEIEAAVNAQHWGYLDGIYKLAGRIRKLIP